jgi:TatD DNase family protein
MAVMSTHPRDFPQVLEMGKVHPTILPCLGVHPWFLHELTQDDWKISEKKKPLPQWIADLEELLMEHPHVPVGEIGLDNFHFDATTKELTTPLSTQVLAFEHQLALATKHQRTVSLHCVRAMGKIMETLNQIQKQHQKLPPRIYFHAFGGKAATVTQLTKSLEKKKTTRLYFGFAPIVNFCSPKTLEVIRTVGLERLVLETDHEDAARVPSSMEQGLHVISEALGVTQEELIARTNQNVQDLYGLNEHFTARVV